MSCATISRRALALGVAAAAAGFLVVPSISSPALADPLALFAPTGPTVFDRVLRDRAPSDDVGSPAEVPPALRRQIVDDRTGEAPGTIIIDTAHTYLYLVLGGGKALRYGIGVGREGFTWSGVETVARKSEWPDWFPPAEMIARQPYLPRMVAGGPGNPLGARALYLGNTAYRIHGTNQPSSIGQHVSSGCIRMLNADVIDLYDRVPIGAKVVVLPAAAHAERPSVAERASATAIAIPPIRPNAGSIRPHGLY